ncbi:MAG: heavy-metal-associated domain-containing protein [Solirubrobacteraceae bacterium]
MPRTYTVAGMTYGQCVSAVREEVSAVAGVSHVDVDLHSGRLAVSGQGFDDRGVRAAVAEACCRPILIAHEGSEDTRHAMDGTASRSPGAASKVLYARRLSTRTPERQAFRPSRGRPPGRPLQTLTRCSDTPWWYLVQPWPPDARDPEGPGSDTTSETGRTGCP